MQTMRQNAFWAMFGGMFVSIWFLVVPLFLAVGPADMRLLDYGLPGLIAGSIVAALVWSAAIVAIAPDSWLSLAIEGGRAMLRWNLVGIAYRVLREMFGVFSLARENVDIRMK